MNIENRWNALLGIGIVIIGLLMVLFMIQRPVMYPLWTVIMIGAVAIISFVTLFKLS